MKFATLVLSLALASYVSSQSCDNPLLQAYGLANLGQPQSGQGFAWCSNLQNGQSCCSSDTVANFQNLIQGLVYTLDNEVADKDRSYVDLRYSVLNNYKNEVSDLTDDDINSITNANQAVGNEVRSEYDFFNRNVDQLSDFDDDDNQNQNRPTGHNDFFFYLQNLQVARTNCLNTLLDVQASLWCLACDANWASQGVNADGTVTLSNDLVNRINQNCLNYTVWSQRFNPLIIANQTIQRVRSLNSYLRSYDNDANTITTGSIIGGVYQTTDPSERTVTLPTNCTNLSCPTQALYVFPGAVLSQPVAANGAGLIGGADALLPDINQGNVVPVANPNANDNWTASSNGISVAVQGDSGASAWTPTNVQSGIPINVAADPAQVSGLSEGVNASPRGAVANGALSNLDLTSDDD